MVVLTFETLSGTRIHMSLVAVDVDYSEAGKHEPAGAFPSGKDERRVLEKCNLCQMGLECRLRGSRKQKKGKSFKTTLQFCFAVLGIMLKFYRRE